MFSVLQKLIFTDPLPERIKERFGYGRKRYILLDCQTNQPATFQWKQCYFFHKDVFHRLYYANCSTLFQNNSCFNITKENSQFEIKSFDFVSTLLFTPVEPKSGCFGCFAYNSHGHIKSFTKYVLKGMYYLIPLCQLGNTNKERIPMNTVKKDRKTVKRIEINNKKSLVEKGRQIFREIESKIK